MSVGQDRVRVSFNPSDMTAVDVIKKHTADLIDLCESYKDKLNEDDGEIGRLWSLAQTKYEEAAMWAVKAATSPK